MYVKVAVESRIKKSARVSQVSSMFDIPPEPVSGESWEFDAPLEGRPWNIGLVVGPSGAGKTTVANHLWGNAVIRGFAWDPAAAVVDGFPKALSIKEVTALLSSVGFSSPPFWLRPFHVLSSGQQFRVTLARALAEFDQPVMDEFTSVVDRTVAQIGSAAVAKAVRRRDGRFVGVTCHYDVIDWLQPDWLIEPHLRRFQWRCLQRRPEIDLSLHRVDASLWPLFRAHHYLSADIHRGAQCFAAAYRGEWVAFNAYLHFPHAHAKNIKMGHRLVVLPDFQGVGIGGAIDDWLGEYLARQGFRYRKVISHPALFAYYAHSPRWRMATNAYRLQSSTSDVSLRRKQLQVRRLGTRGFEYVPLPAGEQGAWQMAVGPPVRAGAPREAKPGKTPTGRGKGT